MWWAGQWTGVDISESDMIDQTVAEVEDVAASSINGLLVRARRWRVRGRRCEVRTGSHHKVRQYVRGAYTTQLIARSQLQPTGATTLSELTNAACSPSTHPSNTHSCQRSQQHSSSTSVSHLLCSVICCTLSLSRCCS